MLEASTVSPQEVPLMKRITTNLRGPNVKFVVASAADSSGSLLVVDAVAILTRLSLPIILGNRWSVPISAAIPMSTSLMQK